MAHQKTMRSQPLRATDGWSISEGVPERRPVVEQVIANLLSWLTRYRRPPDVPAHLREDVGLPPLKDVPYWREHPTGPIVPDMVRLDRW